MLTTSEKDFMREALAKGATEEQAVAFLDKKRSSGVTPQPIERDPSTYSSMEKAAADAYKGGTLKEGVQPVVDLYNEGYFTSEDFVRPMIEGSLAAGGGLIGSGLGPFGTAAGGASGFAIGDQITDMIYHPEKFNDINKPEVLFGGVLDKYERGLEAEALGLGVGSAAQGLFRLGGLGLEGLSALRNKLFGESASSLEKKAGKYLSEYLTRDFEDTTIEREIEEFNKMREKVPGIEGQLGQGTNDPDLLAFSAQIRNTNPKLYDELLQQQNTRNRKAIFSYLRKFFPKDGPGVENTMGALKRARSAVAAGEAAAKEDLEILSDAAKGIKGADEIIDVIRTVVSKAREISKEKLDKAWEILPDSSLEGSKTFSFIEQFPEMWKRNKELGLDPTFMKFLDQVKEDFSSGGTSANFMPSRRVMLHNLRQSASKAGQHAWEIGKNSKSGARPYYALKDELDSLINTVHGEDYATAKRMTGEHKDIFEKGPVGDLINLRKDISSDDLARKFFSSGKVSALQQLKRAVGDTQARELLYADAMKDFRNSSGYNKATEEINPAGLKKWLFKNRSMLKEAGLEAEFGDKKQLADNLIKAKKANKDFQRMSFYDSINVDPRKFFDSLFNGKKNLAEITNEVIGTLKKLKGDSAALAGMQNGFKDHILNQVESEISGEKSLSAEKFNELMKEYEPVNRLLYAGNPEKLEAMRTARKIVDSLSRKSSRTSGNVIPKATPLKILKNFLPFLLNKYSMVSGARGLLDIGSALSREDIGNMLIRASFDETYANALKNATRKEEIMNLVDMVRNIDKNQAVSAGILGSLRDRPEADKFFQGAP